MQYGYNHVNLITGLTLANPETFLPRLKSALDSPSNLLRTTVVTAVKVNRPSLLIINHLRKYAFAKLSSFLTHGVVFFSLQLLTNPKQSTPY